MGYYDEDYELDDDYGDEDQNDLMWLINSWRPNEEQETPPAAAQPATRQEKHFRAESVTEQEYAAEEGFWVDEDGHWHPLPDDLDW